MYKWLRNDVKAVRGEIVTAPEDETGRFRQRRRTRAAIVAAAADLLRAGKTPSVNDVAEAADVSRRTVYLYFPTLDQLLLDATLGLLSQSAVDEAIDAADQGDDAADRVAAMIRAFGSMSAETLPLGRSLIRLTVEPADGEGAPTPRRGYRRVTWIERALEPLRPQLDADLLKRSSCCRTCAASAAGSRSTRACGPPGRSSDPRSRSSRGGHGVRPESEARLTGR
jgi:AcrR family transcriptional regulator